jgi:hypothetical protein
MCEALSRVEKVLLSLEREDSTVEEENRTSDDELISLDGELRSLDREDRGVEGEAITRRSCDGVTASRRIPCVVVPPSEGVCECSRLFK